MQAADFIKYVNNPQLLDKNSVTELQKLVDDFPYFQSAHALLSIASKKWDAAIYQQSLKKTAIVSANRTHLFKLIHEATAEVREETAEKVAPPLPPEEQSTHQEEVRQELDILKAAEISSEPAKDEPVQFKPEPEPEHKAEAIKPVPDAETVLEREIGKEVVNSFVEKELLKTPELNKPAAKEEAPENFAAWLSFLKKNNGQPYREIEEEVNREKARQEALRQEQEAATKENTTPEPLPERTPAPESRKTKNRAIIDKIIENSPGIIRAKEDQRFYAPDIKAKESLLENEHLVTETLAKIYALQGSINKAIRAYEILSIKFPQKRAYFDGLIQKLKHNA